MSGRAAEWDAVVVGGGPAGAATATHLARRGHRVLLLDRAAFPRRKPCGECVNPAGVRALQRLGALDEVLAGAHAPLHGWRVGVVGDAGFRGGFPDGERGIAVSRERLDALLLEHARATGVEVRTGARVGDLLWRDGRVAGVRLGRGGAEIPARLVVGADGLRSVVLRRLALVRRAPRLRKLALTAHLAGVEPLGGIGELLVFAGGCVGVAEVGGGAANATVVVSGRDAAEVARGREAFFDRAVGALPRLRGAVREGPVLATGPFDWPVRAAVADGAMLVGDAAGYYDPFTGQGIYRALRGAELAAEAAAAALERGDLSAAALAPYERARRAAFAPGERLQRVVEAFVSRPRLLRWASGRFRRHPALSDALIAATGDLRPVSSLGNPALLARLIF